MEEKQNIFKTFYRGSSGANFGGFVHEESWSEEDEDDDDEEEQEAEYGGEDGGLRRKFKATQLAKDLHQQVEEDF